MGEVILLAFLLAKIKGYKVSIIFKKWFIYPILLIEGMYIYFQINTFFGNYDFIQFASIMKRTYMYLYIIPIIIYKLYKEGVIGSVCIFIGTFMNHLVMNMNGGKMPVYPSISYVTGYIKEDTFSKVEDIHKLGSASDKFKILSDYIDLGYCILSIGDIFVRAFIFIIIYYTIKTINNKLSSNVDFQEVCT